MHMDEHNLLKDEAAALLSAMGNTHRLKILMLTHGKEWDVGSLAAELRLSQSALSQHLRKLRDIDVVTTRRHGQTIYYRCNSEMATKIMEVCGMGSPPTSANIRQRLEVCSQTVTC